MAVHTVQYDTESKRTYNTRFMDNVVCSTDDIIVAAYVNCAVKDTLDMIDSVIGTALEVTDDGYSVETVLCAVFEELGFSESYKKMKTIGENRNE